ncbi:hypothetical protein [Leyella stercorea]|uniref:hypothetical protein n=1 Tax=Leyella stercorea TaxID=363265 RepID=UPI0024328B74|nr:hypothetical protein [Leyella stercorea]
MKKILSLIALLVVTLTAFAATTSEKLLDDGYAPNGGTITPKAITVDWATQKIVANVDLTNCLEGTNEQIFAISTNSADIANWEQESGSTLHFFYRQKFTEWGSTTTDVHKFAVQYRYKGDSGATNRFYEVKDISNCTIVMDKNGVTIDGTLVFEASLMPQLYKEGANQLYFGSLRGDHPYATYKSVELVTEEGGSTPGETATYEFTSNVETVYWKEIATDDYLDFHQYVKDAKLQLVKELDGTYTATLKDVVVGEDRVSLGDIVIAGLKATENAGTLQIDVPESTVTISAPGSQYDGKSMIIKGGTIDATPAADADSKGSASVKLTILVGNGDMISYEFSDDVYVPNIYNFTSNAYVKAGDEVTNFENAQAVLTEYMEGVYMVKFKKLTLGTKTEDFTIENLKLKPTKDEDGNITFTTSDASGFWNDADETELNFTDFSASVKVGENGFEGFVCKFTTENGQFVYGEKAETPEPPSVVETKIFSDKLNYTFRGTIGTNDPQKLTIESLGNDRYNVILANLNSVNVLSVNVGTVSFKNVAGKTENGITTIEVANPEVTFTDTDQELVDSKKGNLKVMFNNDKAYLNASGAVKIVSFGMSFDYTLVYGTEFSTEEPKDDYAINFDKDALNTSAHGRMLNSFSLQQAGKEKQTKSVKTSKAAYEDHTADEPFTVEAGSELTASFDYTGEWMHSFVYIDFDNDGDFSYTEGQWDQTGTDLVAFSFYSLDSNPKNDASGYNSVGDELTGDARNTYAAPSFKAPAKAGEYRIRFKFDWNCILPGGSSSILSDGGGVWDATLKVVEPVVDGISTINVEAANGEAQLFTIDGVKLNKLQKGLNIVRTADGKVKKVLVK